MTTSFTRRFGGQGISPAQLDYVGLALTGNVTLSWSFQTGDDLVYGAYKTEILSSTGAYAITLADATLVSNGQDISFINDSAQTITIKGNGGATIGTVASGLAWMFYLKDNSTAAGTWGSFQLGAGTSSATAGALAGLGLVAITTLLNQSHPVIETAVGVNLDATYRAQTVVSTGGAISFTFDPVATLGNNWFTLVRNSGTGTLTLNPNGVETIDGALTKVLAPTESCFVICSGAKFYTVGYGRAITSTASTSSIDVTGTGSYTLTAAETAAIVQDYAGVLSGNRIALYGTTPGEWAVFNNTSGAFSLTLKAGAGDTGVVIPQGDYAVVRSNGSALTFATTPSGTQTFTATGVFTWPVCKGAMIELIGPGGGGGRGVDTTSPGSGAGAGGRQRRLVTPPTAGTTSAITINAAGVGATATNTAGTNGGTVTFALGTLLYGVTGGRGGGVAVNNAGAGGTGSPSQTTTTDATAFGDAGPASTGAGSFSAEWGGAMGGSAAAAAGAGNTGGSSVHGPGGGGGGGGTGPAAGGAGGITSTRAAGGGAAGGAAGGASGGAGVAGTAGANGEPGGGGSGGGGGSATGGIGGAGGAPGGGGGGGGYGGTTGGNGGNGARGEARVYWW